MAENSAIEWTTHTFNPWWGCQKVSPGCDHCYAEALDKRTGGAHWGPGADRRRTSEKNWNDPIRWNKRAAERGVRERVFCASMADVFDNAVPKGWRADLFALITKTPHLDWLLLTKRPQNMAKMLPRFWTSETGEFGWPNVWLGTTVENQAEADRRIPILLEVPAAVRFLSCEPLLGPVDLTRIPMPQDEGRAYSALTGGEIAGMVGNCVGWISPLDWIICGGESGPGARPMSIQWARELRDQCNAAGVPFLFKQWGDWRPAGSHPSETPGKFAFGDYEFDRAMMIQTDHYPRQFTKFGARSVMQRVGKKAAGRALDGVTHDGYPEARS